MVLFGWVLWHTKGCWLFNAKSCFYIHIEYIWFGLVGFYGISTIVGYLMPNPLYTYTLNIYDLVWLDFMAYQPLLVINAKSYFYIHITYIWFVTSFSICIFKRAKLILLFTVEWFQTFLSNTNISIYYQLFACTQLNNFKYCYITITM